MTELRGQVGARFQSAGPGVQGALLPALPESDTVSVPALPLPHEGTHNGGHGANQHLPFLGLTDKQ